MQDDFHKQCNRVSVKSKVTSLMEKSEEILEVLKHEERLSAVFESTLILKSITNNVHRCLHLTLVLVSFFLLFHHSNVNLVAGSKFAHYCLEQAVLVLLI